MAAFGAVAIAMGASAIVAKRNSPGPLHPNIQRWYKRLDKPAFTPPDPVFGAAWPVMESGLAFGGYRLLRAPRTARRDTAVGLWLVTTAMVGGWTQIFFGERRLGASAIGSGVMLATGAGYVAVASKVDRPAAVAAVPFVAWLGFATLLAEQVWRRNQGRSDGL
ncbi:TspO/MBR family protein [Sphingomonas sp. UYP23]